MRRLDRLIAISSQAGRQVSILQQVQNASRQRIHIVFDHQPGIHLFHQRGHLGAVRGDDGQAIGHEIEQFDRHCQIIVFSPPQWADRNCCRCHERRQLVKGTVLND